MSCASMELEGAHQLSLKFTDEPQKVSDIVQTFGRPFLDRVTRSALDLCKEWVAHVSPRARLVYDAQDVPITIAT